MVNSRAKQLEKENNKPLKVFQRGSIKVSIWRCGNGVNFYLQKSYTDSLTGEKKNSCSYYKEQFNILSEIINQAIEWEKEWSTAEQKGQQESEN